MSASVVPIRRQSADDRQFVTALARGLAILGCFDASRPSLGVSEIAALVGIPQPTAWRLCRTLLSLGYLTPNADGRLRPALAVLRLGYVTLANLPVGDLVRPYLQELADQYGGAAGVAVRDGHSMRFIERCESTSQLVLNLQVGSRVPIATSAMGWAYMAGLPAELRPEAAGPAAWAAVATRFQKALADYDRTGFVINSGVLHPGYHTAAVPVIGTDGLPLLTLNCGGAASTLAMRQLKEDIGPRLRALADVIMKST